jgi:spoIIIJ-associated protein
VKSVEKKAERPANAPARAQMPAKATSTVKPAPNAKPAENVIPADIDEIVEKAKNYLTDVTKMMNVTVSVEAKADDEGNVRVDMQGDTLGILIGRRGETLDALQYLTSLYVNRGREDYTRVTIDTENYRAKREEALTRLANRMANRAVKTGRKVVLEPMNPYERRILHSALQQNDAVTTHSEGEEPNRHVVITLK